MTDHDNAMLRKARANSFQRYLIVYSRILKHDIFPRLTETPVSVFVGHHIGERMVDRGAAKDNITAAIGWAVEHHTARFLENGTVAIKTLDGIIIVECCEREGCRHLRLQTLLHPTMAVNAHVLIPIKPVELATYVPINLRSKA